MPQGGKKRLEAFIGIRLPESAKQELARQARKRRLSLSDYVRRTLLARTEKALPKETKTKEIDQCVVEYNLARRAYHKTVKGREAPGAVKFNTKRRKLVGAALESYSLAMVLASARGIFLSDHHRKKGYLAPEYAFRMTNVEPFSALVFAARSKRKR